MRELVWATSNNSLRRCQIQLLRGSQASGKYWGWFRIAQPFGNHEKEQLVIDSSKYMHYPRNRELGKLSISSLMSWLRGPCACLVAQLCPTLCDSLDCSWPGSSVHEIFKEEYWSGLPFPPPGDRNPRVKPASPVYSLPTEPLGKPSIRGCGNSLPLLAVWPEISHSVSKAYYLFWESWWC